MVFYGITLVPLSEELWVADPEILTPFYLKYAVFDGSLQRSAQLINILMERGTDQGYFPEPAKSLFIVDTPYQWYESKR